MILNFNEQCSPNLMWENISTGLDWAIESICIRKAGAQVRLFAGTCSLTSSYAKQHMMAPSSQTEPGKVKPVVQNNLKTCFSEVSKQMPSPQLCLCSHWAQQDTYLLPSGCTSSTETRTDTPLLLFSPALGILWVHFSFYAVLYNIQNVC